MDQTRGKYQHPYKNYKSSTLHNRHYENTSFSRSRNPGLLKISGAQEHSLKWRKGYNHKGNYRFKGPHKKTGISSRKSSKTAEDIEEEERKKKLNETAKKLLIKLKSWSAEMNSNKDESQSSSNISQIENETNCKHSEDKINSKKLKKTEHSKKRKILMVKDFQSRIQHKLIEEIMQMPKESLQNVLNDPKINPTMELKISRLVQENKLLIASKLRELAESKMKSLDNSTNPQLLADIDKLIDPVIETDLSVLPFELIKQMENVFQVQFDYPHENGSLQPVDDCALSDAITSADVIVESNKFNHSVKVENKEDLSFYECSTDEDEEVDISTAFIHLSQNNGLCETETFEKNKRIKLSETLSPPQFNSELLTEKNNEKESSSVLHLEKSSENSPLHEFTHEQSDQETLSFVKEFASTTCQTECILQDAFTQTLEPIRSLYGVPLPKETTDDNIFCLQEESNAIQNLINKLNERRFMIFLKLAKMNPSGNFLSDDFTKRNFIETLSNGNLNLIELLKQFFNCHRRKNFSRKRTHFGKKRSENSLKFTEENKNNQHH